VERSDLMRFIRRAGGSRLLTATFIGSAVLLVAGTVGVAENNGSYNGCENVATGVMRLLNNTNLAPPYDGCLTVDVITAKHLPRILTEVPVTWNQQGPPGQPGQPGQAGTAGTNGRDGQSVTTSALGSGNANCPTGGASFSVGALTTYACNGAAGADGKPGADGKTGADGKPGADGTAGAKGQNGADGTSVTSLALDPGNTHCANGGSAFTSVTGTTYACNGAPGQGAAGSAKIGLSASVNADGSTAYHGSDITGSSKVGTGNYEFTVGPGVPNLFSCAFIGSASSLASPIGTPVLYTMGSINGVVTTFQVLFVTGPFTYADANFSFMILC